MIVIHLARKPLCGSVAQNVLKWGTGGINIDGARIGSASPLQGGGGGKLWSHYRDGTQDRAQPAPPSSQGRWPANLILEHLDSCRHVGVRTVRGDNREPNYDARSPGFYNVGQVKSEGHPRGALHGDAHVDTWDCTPGCPVKDLDVQSGVTKGGIRQPTGKSIYPTDGTAVAWNANNVIDSTVRGFDDEGGVSRFFKQVQDAPL